MYNYSRWHVLLRAETLRPGSNNREPVLSRIGRCPAGPPRNEIGPRDGRRYRNVTRNVTVVTREDNMNLDHETLHARISRSKHKDACHPPSPLE